MQKNFFYKHLILSLFGIKMSFKFTNKDVNNNKVILKNKNLKKSLDKFEISGSDNEVFFDDNLSVNNCDIRLRGNNIKLKIKSNTKINNCRLYIDASNLNLTIGANSKFDSMFLHCNKCNGSEIRLGHNMTFEGGNIYVVCPNAKLNIEDDCMFSFGINIWCGDAHCIISKDTNELLNGNANVQIGNRVWVGHNVSLLKNAQVPNNSIIAASSIVSKRFEEDNVIIAGNPAKIIKYNVDCKRDFIEDYQKKYKFLR